MILNEPCDKPLPGNAEIRERALKQLARVTDGLLHWPTDDDASVEMIIAASQLVMAAQLLALSPEVISDDLCNCFKGRVKRLANAALSEVQNA